MPVKKNSRSKESILRQLDKKSITLEQYIETVSDGTVRNYRRYLMEIAQEQDKEKIILGLINSKINNYDTQDVSFMKKVLEYYQGGASAGNFENIAGKEFCFLLLMLFAPISFEKLNKLKVSSVEYIAFQNRVDISIDEHKIKYAIFTNVALFQFVLDRLKQSNKIFVFDGCNIGFDNVLQVLASRIGIEFKFMGGVHDFQRLLIRQGLIEILQNKK